MIDFQTLIHSLYKNQIFYLNASLLQFQLMFYISNKLKHQFYHQIYRIITKTVFSPEAMQMFRNIFFFVLTMTYLYYNPADYRVQQNSDTLAEILNYYYFLFNTMRDYDFLRSSLGNASPKYIFQDTTTKNTYKDYKKPIDYSKDFRKYDDYTSSITNNAYKDYNNKIEDPLSAFRSKKISEGLRTSEQSNNEPKKNLRSTTNTLPTYLMNEFKKQATVFSPRNGEKDNFEKKIRRITVQNHKLITQPSQQKNIEIQKTMSNVDEYKKYYSPSKYEFQKEKQPIKNDPEKYKFSSFLTPKAEKSKAQKQHVPSKSEKLKQILDKIQKLQKLQTTVVVKSSQKIPQNIHRELVQKYKNYLSPSSLKQYSANQALRKSTFSQVNQSLPQKQKSKLDNSVYSNSTSFTYSKPSEQQHKFQKVTSTFESSEVFKKKKDYSQYLNVKTPQNTNKNRLSTNSQKSNSSYQHKYQSPQKIIPANNQLKISINDFQIGKNKGEGKFGVVFCVKHKPTGSIFALKKIQKKVIKSHMMQQQLRLEIKLQAYFNNPNILKLYGFFDDKDHIYLLLQYMQEGTLYDYLKKRKEKMTQRQVSMRIRQIANAIRYLHDLDVAHRDIKPQNIVLSNGVAKLCDFGWSTRCQNRRKTYCGTFDYAAPEILEGKQYDWCVDLWCLGVLTFELLTGKVPFYNISRKQTMRRILNVDKSEIEFPETVSAEARDFVQCLVKKDPHERWRADQLFDHPFLLKYQDDHKYF